MLKHFCCFLCAILTGKAIKQENPSYDYIVVGSGPGGGTLAVELAKKGYSTLLVEAGPILNNSNITIPAFHAISTEDPAITWDFYVKHYNSSIGYRQNVLYPRASALGGCANHHAMIAVYPNSLDFEEMVNLCNDTSWSEKDMREIFKYIEKNSYPFNLQKKNHGNSGFFDTNVIRFLRMLEVDLRQVEVLLNMIGDPFVDLNGYSLLKKTLNTDKEGRFYIATNTNENFERSSFSDYIINAAKNYPLTIWPNTLATKVLFNNDSTPKAIGISYAKGKYLYKASPLSSNSSVTFGFVGAKREVIISGGTFNSPQLLMQSGIGDKDELKSLGIKVYVDLPGVGKNLQDRYEIPVIKKFRKPFITNKCKFQETDDDPCYQKYKKRLGPYTSSGVLSGNLDKASKYSRVPDFMTINIFGGFSGYKKGWSRKAIFPSDRVTSLIIKAKPKGNKGYVRLTKSDPFLPPDINFNYFYSNNDDLDSIVNQIEKQRKRLKGFLNENEEDLPGAHVTTRDQLKQYVRKNSWGHHACCTAKIGKAEDKFAVLDKDFRVRGTKSLRVVDASVFPSIPGYFPVVYIHMIGVKAARVIASQAEKE